MRLELLKEINQAQKNKCSVVLLTCLENDEQQIIYPENDLTISHLDDDLAQAIKQAWHSDRSMQHIIGDRKYFIHVFNPPLRLIIVGAVHIAQALVTMAQNLQYEVVVVDPRQAFADENRFSNINYLSNWPDKALESLNPDHRTAIVTLTHDPKLDEPALCIGLASNAFYVGALGSRKTHQARCQRLQEAGLNEEQLSRIHAPIGLNIGAKSPSEIAISIVAEITAVLRKRS